MGLEASLLATLDALGYEEPTPIQREAIPPLLAGKDLLGQAATGTGKTAAFALPLLQRIAHGVKQRPAALVLVPTRELAIQVGEAVQRYGKELRISVLALYGGQAISPQFHALKRGVDVVVATPGRALDHIRRQTLKLAHVQTVVLDEADEMLDMGFADDLDAILLQTPATKQTALFSATMPPRIKSIAHRHLKHPVEITIAKEPVKAGTAPKVQQTAYVVARQHRGAALARILDVAGPKSALVFCRTRVEVDEVTAMLNGRGRRAEAIHGGMSQQQRDRVMNAFRSGQTELLVATDVAARGLDIPHVSHVINFDLPSSAEVYVHRIGRTGRAGREGVAITILDPREQRLLRSIEIHTKSKVIVAQVPTVADLRATRLERTKTAVKEILDAGELEPFLAVAEALAGAGRPIEVAAAAMKLIHRAQGGEQSEQEIPGPLSRAPEPYRPQPRSAPYQAGRHSSGDRPGRLIMRPGTRPPAGRTTQSAGEPGMARLYVGAGRESGIRPGDLVGAIANEAKVNAGVIGAIEIEERFSIVDVPAGMAKGILEALSRSRIKGRKVPVRVFKD
ncbi:MAG: heavy metal transporter [Nitrospira sp. ST-bin4]|nr:MAG: heavy metal transporter [Nitrospira sp. ST-bin4]